MNKDDFKVCYDVLNVLENRTEEQEKVLKRLELIIRQIEVQENVQKELGEIREALQALDK